MQGRLKRLGASWQRLLGKSGTPSAAASERLELEIIKVLNRERPIEALAALASAYKPEPTPTNLARSVIALDSSVFLRLGTHEDVMDYLGSRHPAPLILPGQSIQEFWNNNLNVAESIASGISKKFEALENEIGKVDPTFADFSPKFKALLDTFRESFGYAYDGGTVRRTIALFEILKSRAIVAYVSRNRFAEMAACRKMTKTPPGFKDPGDGDFFIWLDLLKALLLARENGRTFDRVILVTNDKKSDWSREGVPHPILSAELLALTGVPLETWNLDRLVREVASFSE
jgi:hypothetical protein